ncbi:hypothetical protein EVA_02745 [gut metagenome]|uniref:Uncharacterized protein n=1 Tax=gut metagenome TaxID=749906 RepID=J9D8M6_9ZZZZ
MLRGKNVASVNMKGFKKLLPVSLRLDCLTFLPFLSKHFKLVYNGVIGPVLPIAGDYSYHVSEIQFAVKYSGRLVNHEFFFRIVLSFKHFLSPGQQFLNVFIGI